MQTRQTDPIIAEVRAIRQAYAERFNYDVEAIFQDLRARHETSEDECGVRDSDREDSGTEDATSSTKSSREALDPYVMYADCMEEIKRRPTVIEGFLKGHLTACYLQTTAECIGLQLRKILELIALASMVANQSEYRKHREHFHRDWNGKRILSTLQTANPRFYPVPTRQVRDPSTNKVIETKRIRSGFLTKSDYVRLYDTCGAILHARNPFSKGGQDARSFLENAALWMDRIRVLLSHHQIQLLDDDKQVWVLMEAEADGKVHVYEFQRATDQAGLTGS